MNQELERRKLRIESAREELDRFLASPGADNIVEYLNLALNVFPLHQPSSEQTYFKLGLFDAIQFIEQTQKQVRGVN